jgi:chemotaxis family two-component system sensor kinase Cph1
MSTKAQHSDALDVEKLQAELEEVRDRLRDEKIRNCDELRHLAYSVSHDLREPLRMVTSYTQLLELRRGQQSDAERQEFLHYITDAVQRAERLLTDLVTYSLQLRPLDHPETLVDADAVLEAVLLSMENLIHDSGAQITHDPLPQVTFQFEQLSQLFRELIANAIKFRASEPPRIHISVTNAERGVTFAVRDNGIGIDPRYHDQIFSVFKRLHGRELPGTGIGLAVCKRIVEQHDSVIWVESEPGQGATFRFTLPR